ncbi:MAG TPA: amino acid adenylation domain-containing protein [Longimicrobium sp.]|nr:amino acid adenylation domain-containing protein [Longimicrobium sp.]
MRRRATEEAERPIDLTAGPVFRAVLLRLHAGEHVLLLCMHHIVTDAWSMGVLLRELETLYEAYREDREPALPELPLQYADYAAEQRRRLQGEVMDHELAWWKERLAGAPALLELPTDRPRPAVRTDCGASERMELSAALVERLQAVARAEGASLYMTLMGAFQLLLGRYAGSDDVVVGTPVAGRRPEVEGLIGFFVNTVVMRTDLSGDPGFREVVRRVRATALGTYAHQEVPFERLVAELQPDRSASHSPLFQAVFTLNEVGGGSDGFGGLRVSRVAQDFDTAKFDLLLAMAPTGAGLRATLAYSTDLFEAGTIRRMLGHLRRVLEQVAADPELPLSRLELLDDEERALVLHAWNRTGLAYPSQASIHPLFAEQAARTPGAVAAVFGDASLTYGELDARANRLANHLAALGVGRESRVGMCLERGVEMVVASLAILKAGGAYVPLDPDYPRERLAFMLADSGVRVLLTQESLRAALPVDDGVAVVSVDGDRARIAAAPAEDPCVATGPRDLAYVIYTSGSTGTPKGVAVEHRSVVRLVRDTDYVSLGAADRIAQASNVSFDAATFEIWGALLNGGAMVGIDKDVALSPRGLADALRAHGITTLFLTTALFNAIAREVPDAFAPLTNLLFGGELVDPAAVRRVLDAGAPRRLLHVYGPTENTTFSSWHLVDAVEAGAHTVPIGRTLAHSTLRVLDASLHPAPVGVPGELYVGGDGVARGYLGRPALTADRFVPDPFDAAGGARMYRTGDRVRWTAEGAIEYLARLDGQVKVRGFRIEIGEIEATLRRHPGVADCTVVARTDAAGAWQVVAYVVGDADAESLRAHLRRTLPDHMVPGAFVAMDALPLTPNGKVDRRALPAPDFAAAEDRYVAPRTPTEEVLAAIWAEVLRVERVGRHDGFFELGGHSLLVTRVISRVRAAFGVELPVRAVFDAATVAELAGRVEALRRADAPAVAPVVPVERTDVLPLSFAQERMWFMDRLQPGGTFYNVLVPVRLRGAMDAAALERALGEIVRRHEALRTVFHEVDGRPVQVIAPPAPFILPVETFFLDADEEGEALRRRVNAEAAVPFDLATGPLFRATLLRLADDHHVLLLGMHHAVTDGWSLKVLFGELEALYDAYRAGGASPLPELAVQYADHAVWQRAQLEGEGLERHLAYWRGRLGGTPELLELPTDRPRPAVQSYRGASERIVLSRELRDRLEALARAEGATMFMVLLGAFQALLSRYAGTHDVPVGTTIAGRTRGEAEPLVGLFMNTLVMRTDLSGDPHFREVLRRVREVTLGAYDHQEIPFERLVNDLRPERSVSHSPLFQVMFELHAGGGAGLALHGLESERLRWENGTAKFDLSVALTSMPDGLAGGLTYSTDLFDAATARRMVEHLGRLLERVAGDPDRPLSRLDLRGDEERRQLEAWNAGTVAYPSTSTIHQLFEAQAARTPDATAVVFDAQAMTYRELDQRANRLANHLRGMGVGPEVRVGICMERGVELLPAILGVMKAGGAYVPADPAHPAERVGYVLADSAVPVVLTQARLRDRLPVGPGVRVLCVDAEWDRIAAESAEPVRSGVTAENLCYVIYTSGSTGRPKGVAMHHRGVCNYIHWGVPFYGADRGNGSPVFSSMAVDLTITNLLPLFAGKPVWLLPEASPVEALADVIRAEPGFGLIKITPTHLSLLAPLLTPGQIRDAAHTLVVGADFLSAETTLAWQEHAPSTRLMNEYGPTETVVGCSAYLLPDGMHRAGPVPVGPPIQNLTFHVLDAHGQPVPVGLPGELYIGGAGVARGYLGRPALSAEKFVPDPFAQPGARMYRTGDRARWLPGGDLMILGRTEHQVKIRGYRVELGEVEGVLRKHPAVRECLAVIREDVPGDRRLVAYVVADATADAAALREHLRQSVPEYMVPSAFVRLDALPQTSTGKLDPRTLPAPEYGSGAASLRPRNGLEEMVAELWAGVLGVAQVDVTDNFFDLGGTSLLLYRVYSRLREVRADLRVVDLFRYTTVEALAGWLGDTGPQAGAPALDESRMRAEERRAARVRPRGRPVS